MSATVAPELGFIHRFEPATDPAAPALLLLHGTGGDENDLLPLGRAVVPGAALLSPRGKVLENGMPRFFRRIAEGVFDQQDLAMRTQELVQFIAAASERYQLDSRRLMAVGFSNGANIAASILLRAPRVLAGAVLIRAMVPFIPDTVPNLTGKPILLLSGERDPIIPAAEAARLATLFKSADADVTAHVHPRAGHGLIPDDVTLARDWIHQRFF